MTQIYDENQTAIPDGLVVRIRRSHRRGRGSIPRLGESFAYLLKVFKCLAFKLVVCMSHLHVSNYLPINFTRKSSASFMAKLRLI